MRRKFRIPVLALVAQLPITALGAALGPAVDTAAGAPAGGASYLESFDPGKPAHTVLSGVLTIGRSGAWTGALADGRFTLANRTDGNAIRYYYLNDLLASRPASEPNLEIETTISIAVGGRFPDPYAGAGLLYRFDPESRNYFAFALLGGDRYGFFERDARGFRPIVGGSYAGLADGALNRLEIAVAAGRLRLSINGSEVASLADVTTGGGAVGLLALGRGRFQFDDFRVQSVRAPRIETAAAMPPVVDPSPRAVLDAFLDRQADPAKLSFALRPALSDYDVVFVGMVADRARASYEPAWDQGRIVVEPRPGQTELQIFSTTTDQLRRAVGDARQFPLGFQKAATVMRSGLKVYGFRFVRPGETKGTVYYGLMFVNGRWVIFPKPWWAVVATKTAGTVPPVDWATHEEPNRFSLRHPADWQVRFDDSRGLAAVDGTHGEQVRIWPFHVDQAIDPEMRAEVLRELAGRLARRTEWQAPIALGDDGIRMAGYDGDAIRVASLSVVPTTTGASGIFYMVSAPQESFRAMQETFAGLLRGFQPVGEPPRPPAADPAIVPEPTYRRFDDQTEGAFSLDVPVGWPARGGLRRISDVDLRSHVAVTAPDGSVRVFIGSWDLPPHVAANRSMTALGYPEDSWYMPDQTAMQVRRYTPGAAFARQFAAERFAVRLAALSFAENRSWPEIAERIEAARRPADVGQPDRHLELGEARFTGTWRGRPATGYVLAGTTLTPLAEPAADVTLWRVPYLYGFLAPPERAAEAAAVLAAMIESFTHDPDWVARQPETVAAARIDGEAGRAIAEMVRAAFPGRPPPPAATVAGRARDRILGLVELVDPVTRETYRVESGANYYWIDPEGNVAGTRLAANPVDFGFREAVQLP